MSYNSFDGYRIQWSFLQNFACSNRPHVSRFSVVDGLNVKEEASDAEYDDATVERFLTDLFHKEVALRTDSSDECAEPPF